MQIKVLEYNLLMGLHTNPREGPVKLEQDRVDAARKVVRQEQPDIVVLVEACDAQSNDHGIDVNYRELFNLPNYFYGTYSHTHKHGNAVLSRFPIMRTQNHSLEKRKFIRAAIDLEGTLLHVDVTHPHCHLSEAEKISFFQDIFQDMPQKRYVLAGDFNSYTEGDRERARDEYVKKFNEFIPDSERAAALVDDLLSCKAMTKLARSGLVDTFRAIHPTERVFTMPTDLINRDKSTAERIDYIFCSPDIRVIDAGIIRTPATERASDHHPIYAVLEV